MINKLFYYEGSLNGRAKYTDFEVINADDGFLNNIKKIKRLHAHKDMYDVLTNQVAMLNNEWCWSKKEKRPCIYFMDAKDGSWKNITELTDVEIKHTHNIENLYRDGKFFTSTEEASKFGKKNKLHGKVKYQFYINR